MYILGGIKNRNCFLAIDKMPNLSFMILGDVFLHHHAVIFDKSANKIGFINNHRHLILYFHSKYIVMLLNFVSVGIIIACGMILLCRKKRLLGLRQPLR